MALSLLAQERKQQMKGILLVEREADLDVVLRLRRVLFLFVQEWELQMRRDAERGAGFEWDVVWWPRMWAKDWLRWEPQKSWVQSWRKTKHVLGQPNVA
jgi:hypothetical protein